MLEAFCWLAGVRRKTSEIGQSCWGYGFDVGENTKCGISCEVAVYSLLASGFKGFYWVVFWFVDFDQRRVIYVFCRFSFYTITLTSLPRRIQFIPYFGVR